MAEYYGLEAVCRRMGWKDRRAPVRQMIQSGFIMYQRRRGKHPRRIWYTHDGLIQLWEVAMAGAQREQLVERTQARNGDVNSSGETPR